MNKAKDDDDWSAAAMAHDSLVVDVLLRLKHSTRHQSSRPSSGKLVADFALTGWGVRQPRTVSAAAGVAVGSGSKSVVSMSECRRMSKERTGRRCSPSTPLSWSGGSGGGGGGVDGCEASSLQIHRSPNSRSKISLTGCEVNGASTSKPRKKKTYAELKEEENMLLKERMHLNQELTMLVATVLEHRTENEKLKKIKRNLSTQLMKSNACTGTSGLNVTSSLQALWKAEVPSAVVPGRPIPPPTFSIAESYVIPVQKRGNLMLPDLNVTPPELLDSTNN